MLLFLLRKVIIASSGSWALARSSARLPCRCSLGSRGTLTTRGALSGGSLELCQDLLIRLCPSLVYFNLCAAEINILWLQIDTIVPESEPDYGPTLLHNVSRFTTTITVVQELGIVTEELSIGKISLVVSSRMLSDFVSHLLSSLRFPTVDFHLEFYLQKLTGKEEIVDALGFEAGDSNRIGTVLKAALMEEDPDNLQLDLQPEVHVRVVSLVKSFYPIAFLGLLLSFALLSFFLLLLSLFIIIIGGLVGGSSFARRGTLCSLGIRCRCLSWCTLSFGVNLGSCGSC